MANLTIAAVDLPNTQTPYSVNISQLFIAFTAPLWLNHTNPWTDGSLNYFLNLQNTTLMADDFVDSLTFTLMESMNYNETSANLLRVFLTYSLVNNFLLEQVTNQKFGIAYQANAFTISPVSVIGFMDSWQFPRLSSCRL